MRDNARSRPTEPGGPPCKGKRDQCRGRREAAPGVADARHRPRLGGHRSLELRSVVDCGPDLSNHVLLKSGAKAVTQVKR
jgi:hypothetical protein